MWPRSTGKGCKTSNMVASICKLAGIHDIGVKARPAFISQVVAHRKWIQHLFKRIPMTLMQKHP